jgi:mono/diheme cytochrome c family protein
MRVVAAGEQNSPAVAAPLEPKKNPRFETDVQPILRAHCSRCHAPTPHKAHLDLTNREGTFRGGESGPVVVPGKVEESPLYEVVHEKRMPPDKQGRLSESEIEIIRRWIKTGAPSIATQRRSPQTNVAAVTQHDIIPLMLRHCSACHGASRQEAGLRLTSRAAMLKGGKSGPSLVPGRPDQSLMLKKIRSGQMPPFAQWMKVGVKPMGTADIERLAQWIAAGAPESSIGADVATSTPDPRVSDSDRRFWSFQPPANVRAPVAQRKSRLRNPIDAFIERRLEQNGMNSAAEADRLTLIRRASLDLTGLPPEPEAIQAFLADRESNAYERLIDGLLASPHYGERWARYWLDVAGYADYDGHFGDSIRPYAYRYRDYVIRSFNADKPYSRFLTEQIAGDELADYEHAAVITPEIMENLVATGFLRMTPDGTNPPELNYVPERVDVVVDEMEVFGSAVMGLTLKCARCHDHKYDPIPQRDYYRLVAVFKGAFDEYDWLRPVYRNLSYVTADERQKQIRFNQPLREQIAALRTPLERKEEGLRKKYRERRLAELPDSLRADVRKMLATPAKMHSAAQKSLAQKYETSLRFDQAELKTLEPEFRKFAEETEKKVAPLQDKLLPGAEILALWDRGQASPTYLYRQGDSLKPGRLVGPGVPSILTDGRTPFVVKPPWPGARKTGRRLALARWLVSPEQPLTARVMVNRIWKHHFGRGLVATLDNFGRTGAQPTHPELLDWLAREFVGGGWSIKSVHRLMMTSAAYRRSSARTPELDKQDPENRFLARMPVKRMDAEAIYDSLLEVADRLDRRAFDIPDAVDVRPDGLVTPIGTPRGFRRSIYVLQRRKEIPTLLENFDYPQMSPNCIERIPSTVATQALTLTNDALIHRLAAGFAQRVRTEAGVDPARQIERACWLALGRAPSDQERSILLDGLTRLTQAWGRGGLRSRESANERALTTMCHTLMNSGAFITID